MLYLFLGGFLLFIGYWAARGLSYATPEATPFSIGMITLAFLLLSTLMLSAALVQTTDALYQRGDLDLLLASPLPPWRILIVRMSAIAINVAMFYLLLLGAIWVWLPFMGGGARWMGLAPSVLSLSLLVTGIGLFVARAMFALIGPRNTRVVSQILAGVVGAAIFVAFQAQNLVPREDRGRFMGDAIAALTQALGQPESLSSLPARAALGEPLALGAWVGFCVLFFMFAVWWFGRSFASNAAAIASMGAARKRTDKRVREFRQGLVRALVFKEWRLLARDPLLLSQIALQLIYLLPLFFIFARDLGEEGFGRTQIGVFSGAFVLLSSTLASSLAWLTVSAEDTPDLIAAAPLPREQVERAKAMAAGAPVAALMVLPVAGALFIDPAAALWLAGGIAAAIISACLIAIWHQVPGSRKDFRRRRAQGSFGAAMGQGIVLMGWSAATGLAVAGLPLGSIIPALISLGLTLALSESRPKAQA
ncbi:MAG: hypothetical protein ABL883_13435 [Terricaulis sp.]